MGLVNSTPAQIANDITESISTNISSSIQSSSNITDISQEIDASCEKDVVKDDNINYTQCYKNIMASDPKEFPNKTEAIKNICRPFMTCNMTDVSLDQVIYVDIKALQESDLSSLIKNSVESEIKQKTDGKAQRADINSIVEAFQKSSISQSIKNAFKSRQILTVKNMSVSGVTMKQSGTMISDIIQKSKIVQKQINDLSSKISQESGSSSTIVTVGIIIIMLFLIVFLLLLLSKSKDLVDFFYKLLPILSWVILVSIITITHILVKPGYVSYTMPGEDKEKHLDMTKFLMYMFIYYVCSAIVIYMFFKILKFSGKKYRVTITSEEKESVTDNPVNSSNSSSNSSLDSNEEFDEL
jgi:hypothetical protein